ncbi:type II toxin-antitoxin system VapC family toxin [Thiothrix nivea]|uniref:PilT protein domain protein n=1 Tax=Thiothrix nivea (strain ATCC 35100 / DSM 5205 / JP2) TaxID=870187 RepID=A0A656HMI9_THINJ|nr:PIN domain nuclease [Thiothrix nivea]EIJ36245.1 PilT protein domain protein [Thiothrix nivea DSM 5205]
MIFVDSSVWIDYFNGKSTPQTDWLDYLLGTQPIATGELVLTEVLQGFRLDKDYRQAKELLLGLDYFPMLNQPLALKSADNFRALRKRGITIRKTIDVLITTFCIEKGLPLLQSDGDFQPFHDHFQLKNALPKH